MQFFPTRGSNTLELLLTYRNKVLLVKNVMLTGLGQHESAIHADTDIHPKEHEPVSRNIYIWKKVTLSYCFKLY